MAAMGKMPWGNDPLVEWDEANEEHVSRHGIIPWEVEEMITQGEYVCIRHPSGEEAARSRAASSCGDILWVACRF